MAYAIPAFGQTPTAPDAEKQDVITIQGQRLEVESRIDRHIYRLPDDAQSTVGTLGDVLSGLPSVDVDPDGIVTLRGDANVLILIDGRPATQLQGSAAGDNLQSIPAAEIERIEILTTPPADLKADGAGGAINIITRHSAKASGAKSVQAGGGSHQRLLVGASQSLTLGKVDTTLHAGFRRDYRERLMRTTTTGQDPATGVAQQSVSALDESMFRNIPNIGASATMARDATSTWQGDVNWSGRGGLRNYTQSDTSLLASGSISSATQRLSRGHDPEGTFAAALESQTRLGRNDGKLTVALHRELSQQHEHYDYRNLAIIPAAAPSDSNLDLAENHGVTDASVKYSQTLPGAASLKLGYAFQQDHYTFGNLNSLIDSQTGISSIVAAASSRFAYRQNLHAIYQVLQLPLGDTSLQGGLRTEWSESHLEQITDGTQTLRNSAAVFPSLHLERAVSDQSTLSLGASRRITRPDPSNLDPFIDREYTPNWRAGNAQLRPEYTQAIEAGLEHAAGDAGYQLTAYLRRNRDSTTDLTQYLGNGISLATKTNLPRDTASGLEFSLNGKVLRDVSYKLSGNAFHAQIDATALGYPGLRSTNGVNTKARFDYHSSASDSLQFSISRTDKRLTPQGSISAITVCNAGFKHALTRELSFVSSIADLFNGQHYHRTLQTPAFSQDYVRQVEGRIWYAGLVYTPGSAGKPRKDSFDFEPGVGDQ